ncbi:MAG TPA: twin-arginine translocase TatA/TatE family subunit [Dongiaceae bacterium]|jgi:sec-independent protein translocase protein TatA
MGIGSWWHWLILLVVVLLLFGGRGKIPSLMKDLGQGINAFKKGLKETKEEEHPQAESSSDKQGVIDRS